MLTVAKQSFYAGYPVMSIFVAMRGLNADTAAKSALSLPITNMKLPARELIPCISKFCLDEWQDIWDWCEGNKLYSIYPLLALSSIAKTYPATIPSYSTDSELVILVSLTHSYCVVNGDDSRTCPSCGIPLTVKQLLVECANLRDIHEKYFSHTTARTRM